jgi:hypothetical protein
MNPLLNRSGFFISILVGRCCVAALTKSVGQTCVPTLIKKQ